VQDTWSWTVVEHIDRRGAAGRIEEIIRACLTS
jgi:hypothetical protein